MTPKLPSSKLNPPPPVVEVVAGVGGRGGGVGHRDGLRQTDVADVQVDGNLAGWLVITCIV